MTDEFGATLETYKYRVDESFSWLQFKFEEKLNLLCKKDELTAEFKTLRDRVTGLGKKLDERGTTTAMLLEFMKSFAQMLQEALLNKLSAGLTAMHAALKEVQTQSQVTGQTITDVKDNVAAIKSATKTSQAGTCPISSDAEGTVQGASHAAASEPGSIDPSNAQSRGARCRSLACSDCCASAGSASHAHEASVNFMDLSFWTTPLCSCFRFLLHFASPLT